MEIEFAITVHIKFRLQSVKFLLYLLSTLYNHSSQQCRITAHRNGSLRRPVTTLKTTH